MLAGGSGHAREQKEEPIHSQSCNSARPWFVSVQALTHHTHTHTEARRLALPAPSHLCSATLTTENYLPTTLTRRAQRLPVVALLDSSHTHNHNHQQNDVNISLCRILALDSEDYFCSLIICILYTRNIHLRPASRPTSLRRRATKETNPTEN